MPCQCDSPLHPTTGQSPSSNLPSSSWINMAVMAIIANPQDIIRLVVSSMDNLIVSPTNPKVFNFQVVFGVRFDIYIHYMKTLTPLARETSLGSWNIDRVYFVPQDFRAAAVVQFGGQLQLSSGSDELPENGNAMVYPDSSSWLL